MEHLGKIIFIIAILSSYSFTSNKASKRSKEPLYKSAAAPIQERVKYLLSRMTLEGKVNQLNQSVLGFNNNENNLGATVQAQILTSYIHITISIYIIDIYLQKRSSGEPS